MLASQSEITLAHLIFQSDPSENGANTEVKLRQIAGKLVAVNTFTGFNTVSRVQAKTDELRVWMAQKNWKALGQAQLARYDPPWTLPMFRRNEVMIEVENLL